MEEEERMWMMAAAAGFSGTLILGLLLYRDRLIANSDDAI